MDAKKIESGVELFTRLTQRPSVENLYPELIEKGPFANEYIEITGGSGLGKTTLLLDFIKRCLLPVEHSGRDCGAILINTDHHFDMFRFISMIDADSSIIKSCLNKFIILNCYDSDQLQITFYNLERILLEHPNIGFVAIDSISSHYWQYRSSNGLISIHAYHCKILSLLKENVKNCNVVVAYTQQEHAKQVKMQEIVHRIALNEIGSKFFAVVTKNGTQCVVPYVINQRISFPS